MTEDKLRRRFRVRIQGLEEYRARIACREACPLGTDTKGYVAAIAAGDSRRAYLLARRVNPLPSVCGRVCQAPCEDACARGQADGPVALRALKRFACDRQRPGTPQALSLELHHLQRRTDPAPDITGNDLLALERLAATRNPEESAVRVAVIGSGPAGLAAAHDLALLNYRVTIFEAAPLPGGMLRWGIPEFRLSREQLEEEIQAILSLGVELKTNMPVGPRLSLADLRQQGYQGIFIAAGLQAARALPLEGIDLQGVFGGLAYLRNYRTLPMTQSCLVIGGGGVALDCAQLALRQGARQVTVASLESWEEMPARPSEKQDAADEGIRFRTSLGPKRILGDGTRVTGAEFLEVETLFDEKGLFSPRLRPGTERILHANTLLLAVGQIPAFPVHQGRESLETTAAGKIRVGKNLETNLPGVFAGGDLTDGPQNLVKAIADGQRAARSIHEHVSGRKYRLHRTGALHPVDPASPHPRSERTRAARPPQRPVRERVRNQEEIDLCYEERQAREQAARCRQCQLQTVFNRRLCILCGTCVDGCAPGALRMVRIEELEGDHHVQKYVEAIRREAPGGRPLTAVIKDEVRCVRCGICARRCPTGALTLEAFHYQEEWLDA